MKKIFLQHCTVEQKAILDLARTFNKPYADKTGFEYIISDMARRCPQKPIYYEKIGYLKEMLPKLEEGSLVVWADADTICVKNESFEHALPVNGVFGMVRMLHGVDRKQPRDHWNIGVIVMKNCHIVRDFINRVLARTEPNDELAAVSELRQNCWMLGDGVPVSSIDYKWNTWKNNQHICKQPNVVSWHGYKTDKKLPAMQAFISNLKR